jgi:hypothetical protein
MLRRVALVRTGISEERRASIIRVTKIGVSGSLILVTLMINVLRSSETSVLTRPARRNISEGGILHSHRRVNRKPYTTAVAENELLSIRALGSTDIWGALLYAGRTRFRVSTRSSIVFSNFYNPFSRIMALSFTPPLIERSTR